MNATVLSRIAVPAVLDIEASGFGATSYPIEIGFVLGSGGAWCSLIRPDPSWRHWDPQAEAVHGPSRALVERHGRTPHEVATTLNARLAAQTVYCDAWGHDYPWLARLYDAAGLSPSFRLEHLRRLLDDDDAPRFAAHKTSLGAASRQPRHRASADALVLQTAWRQTMAERRAS